MAETIRCTHRERSSVCRRCRSTFSRANKIAVSSCSKCVLKEAEAALGHHPGHPAWTLVTRVSSESDQSAQMRYLEPFIMWGPHGVSSNLRVHRKGPFVETWKKEGSRHVTHGGDGLPGFLVCVGCHLALISAIDGALDDIINSA